MGRHKKIGKSNYFLEKEMNELVKEYKKDKNNQQIFKEIEPGFIGIINGMINKQFYRNYHIKNNKSDAMSDCMTAILSSIDRYNPDKGRLFAYTNRVVKNTLMNYYKKSRKIRDNELNYTDIVKNIEDTDDGDSAQKINIKKDYSDDIIDIDTQSSPIDYYCKNVVLNVDNSIYIIYNYINYLYEAVDFYRKREDAYTKLINDMQYDYTVNFDLCVYNNSVLINKYIIYKSIIDDIYISLDNLIKWIDSEYTESITNEPISYDGEISNRALGYIRNFVKKHLKSNLSKKYDINELVEFLNYIVYKRHADYNE